MSGLDNLARLLDAATHTDKCPARDSYLTSVWCRCDAEKNNAALIAAAPEMAALLQACAEAFGYIDGPAKLGQNGGMSKANGGSGFPKEIARDMLARLADFDRGLA